MIRGREHRLAALRHMRRIVKPGGVLVLHVHNVWYHLHDPGGPWWLCGNLWQSWNGAEIEFGDKYFPYRQIPQMFLHVFRRGEICAALHESSWSVREVIPLSSGRYAPLRWPFFFSHLRANGWILVAG
jgi:SAM-dependent methyltransferase